MAAPASLTSVSSAIESNPTVRLKEIKEKTTLIKDKLGNICPLSNYPVQGAFPVLKEADHEEAYFTRWRRHYGCWNVRQRPSSGCLLSSRLE
jgi:hypothetical protein